MLKIETLDSLKPTQITTVGYKSWFFPGGENGFILTDYKEAIHAAIWCRVTARIQNGNDFLELLSCIYAIKEYNNRCRIILRIPYWPAARQDRVANRGECLTTKIYADIINSLNCERVEIIDPHSDVTPALINNCHILDIRMCLDETIQDCKPDFIISPDAGATKKIYKQLKDINCNLPVLQCLKIRDTKTGKLTDFSIVNTELLKSNNGITKKGLIIDDICDGGATFIGLAEILLKKQTFLYLHVTHGIFSKGYNELLKKYEKIYSTNSFQTNLPKNENVIIYNV